MAPRPNPTQTRWLDEVEQRRELKLLLPSTIALDRQELAELLDFSNQSARCQVLRLKLLRRAIAQLAPDDVLRLEQYSALVAFAEGRGPRPPFARLATADGHYIGESLLPAGEQRPAIHAPGPLEDPGEPGRYVQPKGDYAIPGYAATPATS